MLNYPTTCVASARAPHMWLERMENPNSKARGNQLWLGLPPHPGLLPCQAWLDVNGGGEKEAARGGMYAVYRHCNRCGEDGYCHTAPEGPMMAAIWPGRKYAEMPFSTCSSFLRALMVWERSCTCGEWRAKAGLAGLLAGWPWTPVPLSGAAGNCWEAPAPLAAPLQTAAARFQLHAPPQ